MAPTGTLIEVEGFWQMDIMRLQDEMNRTDHHVHVLDQEIADLTKRLEQAEKDRAAKFKHNDVYEVNKRIERLQGKIALLESNSILSALSAVSVNFVFISLVINNLFLVLAWWIYG